MNTTTIKTTTTTTTKKKEKKKIEGSFPLTITVIIEFLQVVILVCLPVNLKVIEQTVKCIDSFIVHD